MPSADAPQSAPQRALPPLLTVSIGIMLLCLMDVAIKYLVQHNHVFVVLFGRCIFATAFAWIMWRRAGRPNITRDAIKAHGVRGAIIAVSALLFFFAVKVMPLAEVLALSFLAPLLIPFFAAALLKERVRATSLIALAIGFCGAYVTVADGLGASHGRDYAYGVGAIIISAFGYALSMTLLRARAGKDGAEITSLFTALVPGLIVAGPAMAFGSVPALSDLPVFAAMAALLVAGVMLMTMAYARAEAQALAPMEYAGLLWGALFGFLFFREVPREDLWLGAAIIIAACLFAAWAERRGAKAV